MVVTLDDELKAFWKRGDVDPPGVQGVRREVAAYDLALALEWDELVPVAALRTEERDGHTVEIASMEYLPAEARHNISMDEISTEDRYRAGVFDALIGNPDRTHHNYCGIPTPDGREFSLKLYDHELAFASDEATSCFWDGINHTMPNSVREHLNSRYEVVRQSAEVRWLLGPDSFESMITRMQRLIDP